MALTQQQVLETLNDITAPGAATGLVEAGAVRNLEIEGTTVKVVLAVSAPQPSTAK